MYNIKPPIYKNNNLRLTIIFSSIVILFIVIFLICLKNCDSYHDIAIESFSRYTTNSNIIYDNYQCGSYPNYSNGTVICTFTFRKQQNTLACEVSRFARKNNICYPVGILY